MRTAMQVMQEIAVAWGVRCFGFDHMNDRKVRALRMVEEAIELCQAVGVHKNQVELCVDVVYSKEPGDPLQELGGVVVTASVCAAEMGTDIDTVFLDELQRCLAKSPEHFAKRNENKLAMGLTGYAS